jgi:hypothetical protein
LLNVSIPKFIESNEKFERFANAMQAGTLALQSLKLFTGILRFEFKKILFGKDKKCMMIDE